MGTLPLPPPPPTPVPSSARSDGGGGVEEVLDFSNPLEALRERLMREDAIRSRRRGGGGLMREGSGYEETDTGHIWIGRWSAAWRTLTPSENNKMCSGAAPVAVDVLLELSALDDLASFKHALQHHHHHSPAAVNSFASWYGRSAGPARQLGLHDRTPLMVAALHGSTAVLAYLLSRPDVDVALRSPSDGATALQLASADAARMLLDPSAKPTAPSPKKKEYPTDLTMPDINDGVYGTDEFRMYSFKVKTCSRAYTHDWTECPFVHPGENARRRCPAKYAYSCVPCPEFRKASSCRSGDACEYAHGVFESWLHPAQYRTRLCKDEVGCGRRVCFFAHRKEELRSVDRTAASVGVVGSFDAAAAAMSPSALGSSAAMWMNQPPSLQLPSATKSRLQSSLSYRDRDLGMGAYQQQQKVFDEMSSTASPRASWPARANSFTAATRATDYGSLLGSLDPSVRSQLLAGYVSSLQSSAAAAAAKAANSMSSFGLDHSMAKAIISSRSAAFAQRSQSFCDRGAAARHPPSALSPASGGTGMSGWGSRDGTVDWGIHGEELSKLRKSATFAFRGNNRGSVSPPKPVVRGSRDDEPDLSWVQSLVKDGPAAAAAAPPVRVGLGLTPKQYQIDGVGTGRSEMFSPWVEVEQLVA